MSKDPVLSMQEEIYQICVHIEFFGLINLHRPIAESITDDSTSFDRLAHPYLMNESCELNLKLGINWLFDDSTQETNDL